MLREINITQFGSFRDLDWKIAVRNPINQPCTFKAVNVIYGRNYSGKTTLSRILRSLETGAIPDGFAPCHFQVLSDTSIIDPTRIPDTDHNIRVYNQDFVKENLSILRDSDGQITPFAVLGSDNQDLEREIEAINGQLGSVDNKAGLLFEQHLVQAKYLNAKRDAETLEGQTTNLLRAKANNRPNGIKHNKTFGFATYNIARIRADIATIRKSEIEHLTDAQRLKREVLLTEVPLPDLSFRQTFTPMSKTLLSEANEVLTTEIEPSEGIQELLDDPKLHNWVEEGITHHRGKRQTCAFCTSTLPTDIWQRLGRHFDQASKQLQATISSLQKRIRREIDTTRWLQELDFDSVYPSLREDFTRVVSALSEKHKSYAGMLELLSQQLHARSQDIFTARKSVSVSDTSPDIQRDLQALRELIEKHNKRTSTLNEEQALAREALRLDEVLSFINDVDLDSRERRLTRLEADIAKIHKELEQKDAQTQTLITRRNRLLSQMGDERKGAAKVNEYLRGYFGHNSLRLEAQEQEGLGDAVFKFRIMRGNTPALNLSEGECSLVAFCYFIARLSDDSTAGKQLVIWIDDPISSLDSNHIFFVYSLIEGLIAKPMKFGQRVGGGISCHQLFISTHNLEFLKLLRRMSKPENECEQFILTNHIGVSKIALMPKHLKKYITEFNYLFGEICICADPAEAENNYHSFYDFGNNIRKFLEAYLFFKYPSISGSDGDYNGKVRRFFSNPPTAEPFVNRLTNEFSHLGGYIDRGAQPMDVPEISRLAKFVLRRMRATDPDQYKCLLDSVRRTDPLQAA